MLEGPKLGQAQEFHPSPKPFWAAITGGLWHEAITTPINEAYENSGFVSAAVLRILTIPCIPGLILHGIIVRSYKLLKKTDSYRTPTADDVWVFGWLVLNTVIFTVSRNPRPSWLLVFPIARLLDILYVRLRLLLRKWTPHPSPGRSVLLVCVHYFEIIVIFAYFYCTLQAVQPNAFEPTLTRASSAFFSLVTAATVGYGDIRPSKMSFGHGFMQPATLIFFEIFWVFFLVVVDIPRIISTSGNVKERDAKG